MNRRTFLKTTGVAATTPLLSELVSEATEAPNVQHVVLVMMENRSFHSLFGWLPNADGKQAGLEYPNKTGGHNATWELAPDFTGCAYGDPDHSYSGARLEVNGGKMNGFLMPESSGLNAIGYYREHDLPFRAALADCAAGQLPAVSFVDPTYTTLDNLDEDDHPFSDVRNGDAFLAKTFKAVSSSPNWPNTVLIFNYDEWGGFYDHVPPPRALAPNNVDTDLVDGKALLGCRVPTIVASPWTLGNPSHPRVNHTVFDHTSVLKMIESVWDVPAVAARERSNDVGNLLEVLNETPQLVVP